MTSEELSELAAKFASKTDKVEKGIAHDLSKWEHIISQSPDLKALSPEDKKRLFGSARMTVVMFLTALAFLLGQGMPEVRKDDDEDYKAAPHVENDEEIGV